MDQAPPSWDRAASHLRTPARAWVSAPTGDPRQLGQARVRDSRRGRRGPQENTTRAPGPAASPPFLSSPVVGARPAFGAGPIFSPGVCGTGTWPPLPRCRPPASPRFPGGRDSELTRAVGPANANSAECGWNLTCDPGIRTQDPKLSPSTSLPSLTLSVETSKCAVRRVECFEKEKGNTPLFFLSPLPVCLVVQRHKVTEEH